MKEIISQLFSNKNSYVYGILDGASVKKNMPLFLEELEVEAVCLYRGEMPPDLAARAPYLVKLTRGSELLKLWLEEGWGKNWGIFVNSYAEIKVVRRFFRKFLKARDTDDKIFYFRFYDPRVLVPFLEACNQEERESFFGPVLEYFTESGEELLAITEKKKAVL
ncbi:MAG: DUF4123 domain-containing protein [Lentisphaeraceae bacterium]|nr:DUF4123 domain-containing protein [Lentisphaeraceae bacterium]